ncbi:hypothetical protein VQ01_13590 [Tamlana sp. s12]|nr:hypothetical protein VQ01_13590 [Tamlana sp. s12]
MIFININLFGQSPKQTPSETITIDSTYVIKLEKPFLLKPQEILKNNTNSKLYVFNAPSFKYFQELRQFLKMENETELDTVINRYHQLILESQDLYDKLAKDCRAQQNLYEQSICEFQESVNHLESSVNRTEQALLESNTSLEAASSELKSYRKKRFWSNMGAVGAGTVIGVLIGVLVAN